MKSLIGLKVSSSRNMYLVMKISFLALLLSLSFIAAKANPISHGTYSPTLVGELKSRCLKDTISFSPKRTRYVVECNKHNSIYDVSTGKLLMEVGDVSSLIFSSNDNIVTAYIVKKILLAHGHYFEHSWYIYDLHTQTELFTVNYNGTTQASPALSLDINLAFSKMQLSPDNKYLSIGRIIYEVPSGRVAMILSSGREHEVSFSQDGRYVTHALSSNGQAQLNVYDLVSRNLLSQVTLDSEYYLEAGITPNNQYVYFANEKSMKVYGLAKRLLMSEIKWKGEVEDVRVSSDAKVVLATYKGRATVYSLLPGKALLTTQKLDLRWFRAHLSPNGKFLVTYDSDSTQVYNISTRKLLINMEGGLTVSQSGFRFSPDEKNFFVTTSLSGWGNTCVYDLVTGKILFQGDRIDLWGASFSPNGKYVVFDGYTTNSSRDVRIIDIAGKRVITPDWVDSNYDNGMRNRRPISSIDSLVDLIAVQGPNGIMIYNLFP